MRYEKFSRWPRGALCHGINGTMVNPALAAPSGEWGRLVVSFPIHLLRYEIYISTDVAVCWFVLGTLRTFGTPVGTFGTPVGTFGTPVGTFGTPVGTFGWFWIDTKHCSVLEGYPLSMSTMLG